MPRINALAVADDEEEFDGSEIQATAESCDWLICSRNRYRGSIHSDIWHGTAAELASRRVLGVYPTSGWWKLRQGLGRYNNSARYSLLVSITTPKTDVDL
jgi:hypothetical protein